MFDLSRIIPHLDHHGSIPRPITIRGEEYPHVFATVASSVTKFAHLGIRQGAHLVFNLDAPYEEGHPACFVNLTDKRNPQLLMSTTAEDGFEYIGRLLYCVNNY